MPNINAKSTPDRLTKTEERALLSIIKDDTASKFARVRARDKMIICNMRFVDYAISAYYSKIPQDLKEDIRQEGAIGLNTAIDKFNVEKDVRFSTYAVWWIRQVINKSLNNTTRTIRTPVYVTEAMHKVNKLRTEIFNLYGREPSDAELEEQVGFSAKRIAEFRNSSVSPTTLEHNLGNSTQILSDIIEDETADDPEMMQILKDLNHKISDVLIRTLTPREEHIIRLRQGFGSVDVHTLEQIGDKLNLTKERIRQIEADAMKKLRRSPEIARFKQDIIE